MTAKNTPNLVPDPDQLSNTTEAPVPDPFDPANLRLSQSFTETVGVKKLLTTIPVRKPSPQDFVRVHPVAEYRENFPIIELKDEREEYIVTAELVPELIGEFVTKTLFTAINRQGILFFWPVRLPSPDGKDLDWWRSAREAAELAMQRLGARQSQHEPRRLRHLQGRECHQRAGMAGAGVLGPDQDRLPRPPDHHHRSSGHQAASRAGVTCRKPKSSNHTQAETQAVVQPVGARFFSSISSGTRTRKPSGPSRS